MMIVYTKIIDCKDGLLFISIAIWYVFSLYIDVIFHSTLMHCYVINCGLANSAVPPFFSIMNFHQAKVQDFHTSALVYKPML